MYARDTFTGIRKRVFADLAGGLPNCDPYQRRSALYVIGTVLAKLQDGQFGYLDWQARQAVPFTASGEYQLGWAALRNLQPKPAATASGNAIFTGNAGAPVFSALQLRRSDGTLYTVPLGGMIGSDGTASVRIVAQLAGSIGNADPAATLTLVSTLSGVSGSAVVDDAGLGGGSDIETADSLRSRMLAAYAAPPQGGDLDDYVAWAKAIPAVTRAWCYGGAGGGAVVVYFMEDDARADLNGLPTGTNGVSQYEARGAPRAAGDQLIIADALFRKRAATALLFAAAPVPQLLPLALSEVPADDAIRQAISDAFIGFLRREASPGGVILSDLSLGGIVRRAHLDAAIGAVPGLDHYVITSPAADVTAPLGTIAVPGMITYS